MNKHKPDRVRPVWRGTVQMNEERYTMLAGLAGRWLEEHRPAPVPMTSRSVAAGGEQRALYVVVNAEGYACYAGQTRPPSAGSGVASRRLGHHLREQSKRQEWAAFWVLPLRDDTPDGVVNSLERDVCARLSVPLQNRTYRAAERRR